MKQTATFYLSEIVEHLLHGYDYVTVSEHVAEVLLMCTGNKHTCHVQLPSDPDAVSVSGITITKPRLWNINCWNASVERGLKASLRAEAERNARFVYQANVNQVVRCILKQWPVHIDQANTIARVMLDRKQYDKILAMGVKSIIMRVEDIP